MAKQCLFINKLIVACKLNLVWRFGFMLLSEVWLHCVNRGFWSEVQRVYENRMCTSLPSSLRTAGNSRVRGELEVAWRDGLKFD